MDFGEIIIANMILWPTLIKLMDYIEEEDDEDRYWL